MFSFSSKPFLALVILGYFLSIQSISVAQESVEEEPAPVNENVNFNMPIAPQIQDDIASPEKPIVPEHPPVVERSHAALMPLSAVALPIPSQAVVPKTPLAWRAKSHKLGSDKYADDASVQIGPLCRNVDGSYLSTMQAIISACNNTGFRVTHANKAAGEILAVNVSDSNSRIVFAVWEKPAGRTWVKAGIDRGASSSLNTQLVSILDTVCGTILPKGKI
jgi:hypothetical protein